MVKVTGLKKVIANLNKEAKKIDGVTLKGLIRASIVIRRDMDKKFPLIPLDTGNLRSSWFTVTNKGGMPSGRKASFKGESEQRLSTERPSVINEAQGLLNSKTPGIAFGFTAFYAWYVHEMVGVNYKRPGSGGKFLQGAINRNKKLILKILAEEAKIK